MSVISEGARKIFNSFSQAGVEAFIVGGAVRNHLWNLPIADRDFSVACAPQKTIAICEAAGLRHIPTGIDHGTITIIAEGEKFEATSFRKDVQTDGRRALTSFEGTIEDDAMRRDFTVNALYMNAKGEVIDPLGSKNDIAQKTLRFVGSAQLRICEDYLRILRFFRFLAQYDLTPDDQAIDAIRAHQTGLSQISKERIGQEMKRLIQGPSVIEALDIAKSIGTLDLLDIRLDLQALASWIEKEGKHNIDANWQQRWVAAHGNDQQEAWRLSNAEAKSLWMLKEASTSAHAPAVLGHIYGIETAILACQLRDDYAPDQLVDIKWGASQRFPITGKDLKHIFPSGPQLGEALRELKDEWYRYNFALDKDALLDKAREKLMN